MHTSTTTKQYYSRTIAHSILLLSYTHLRHISQQVTHKRFSLRQTSRSSTTLEHHIPQIQYLYTPHTYIPNMQTTDKNHINTHITCTHHSFTHIPYAHTLVEHTPHTHTRRTYYKQSTNQYITLILYEHILCITIHSKLLCLHTLEPQTHFT